MNRHSLRSIPSVEKLVQALGDVGLPRPVVVAHVRRELALLRTQSAIPEPAVILSKVRAALAQFRQSRLQPVINATGILVHTNLGRAPLPVEVMEAITATAGYSNLEFDLEAGERGGRASYLHQNLALLCGAEAAIVVNNCAAALVLILRHFVRPPRDQVVISRGELVQIGGGFRIPEILEASGARLREVGTTNRTSLNDYARALRPETALILKVHRSNFFMSGFVESVATESLAGLARKKRVPLVEDLGSGAMVATDKLAAIEHEPTPAEVLKSGVDLVCCSGDKLLGGPQAGLIAGKARLISALQREPFFRALRCDKLVLSGLQAIVDLYLSGHADKTIPVLQMLREPIEPLRERACRLLAALAGLPLKAAVAETKGQIGGGTLPRSTLPSVAIDLSPTGLSLPELAARLREGVPPVVTTISSGKLRLDLRTVFPAQDDLLVRRLKEALATPVK